MDTPPAFVWSWPGVDPAALDPTPVTVARDPCGRRPASLAVDVAGPEQAPATGAMVGVDLGLTDLAVTSDGERIANPSRLARRERNLARYQRRMARKQRGAANRGKAKAKVARAQRKVRAAHADFPHKTSARLVRDHDMIVIDRWFPGSKTRSACGHLLAELSLGTRTWQCPSCGTRHDRGVNAAKNILAAGRAVSACGADVRHSGSLPGAVGCEAGISVLQGGE